MMFYTHPMGADFSTVPRKFVTPRASDPSPIASLSVVALPPVALLLPPRVRRGSATGVVTNLRGTVLGERSFAHRGLVCRKELRIPLRGLPGFVGADADTRMIGFGSLAMRGGGEERTPECSCGTRESQGRSHRSVTANELRL